MQSVLAVAADAGSGVCSNLHALAMLPVRGGHVSCLHPHAWCCMGSCCGDKLLLSL